MAKRFGSDVLASVHETALGMTEAGVMSKRTMKEFDQMCLTQVEDLTPEKVREIRLRKNVSQAEFARHLNVTAGLVSQWERGEKRPRGASLKLLTLVGRRGLKAVAGRGTVLRLCRHATRTRQHPGKGPIGSDGWSKLHVVKLTILS